MDREKLEASVRFLLKELTEGKGVSLDDETTALILKESLDKLLEDVKDET